MDTKMIIDTKDVDSKFYISLENIDLALLPITSYKKKAETVPIWNILDSQGPEYYEFELHTKDKSDDDDDPPECLEVQRCHICDVGVPVAFLEAHSRSTRHRACSAIAGIALDRTRRQIAIVPISVSTHGNWNYCPSCSCTVSLSNIEVHENSKEHVDAVKHERLLSALASVYEDRNNATNIYNLIKDDITNTKENCKVRKVIEKSENVKTVSITVKDNINADKKTNTDSFDIANYISDINKNSTHNVEYKTNTDYVTITAMSGAVIKIHLDDFHGFFESGNKTMCKLCREVVGDKNKHCLEIAHKDKVKRTITNKQGIRQLDTIWNHCVLCNEIVENSEAHILCSGDHNKLLQIALLRDDIVRDAVAKTDAKGHFCSICNLTVPPDQSLPSHNESNIHKHNVWLAYNDKLHHHLTPMSKRKRNCLVCQIAITGTVKNANEHTNSENHIRRHAKILEENSLKKINSKTYFCATCDVNVPFLEDLTHIGLQKHREKLLAKINQKTVKQSTKDTIEVKPAELKNKLVEENENFKANMNYYCTFCGKYVEVSLKRAHEKTTAHIINSGEQNRPHYLFSFENSNLVKCKICKVTVSYSKADINLHRKDKGHRAIYNALMKEHTMFRVKHRCYCECCDDIIKVNEEYYHMYDRNHVIKLNNFFRNVDEATVKINARMKFEKSIVAERQKKRQDKAKCLTGNSFFFDNSDDSDSGSVAESFVSCVSSNNSEFSNLNKGFIHEKIYANTKIIEAETREDRNNSDESKSDDDTNEANLLNTNQGDTDNIPFFMQNTPNSKELRCKICLCLVSNKVIDIVEHSRGAKHTKNYDAFLLKQYLEHKIVNNAYVFNCKICEVDVKSSEIFSHVDSAQHLSHLLINMSVTDVKANDDDIEEKIPEYIARQKQYLMEKVDNNTLLCKLCLNELTDDEKYVIEHVKRVTHMAFYDSLMLENEVTKTGDHSFCNVCDTKLSEVDELEHINKGTHKANFTNNPLPVKKAGNATKQPTKQSAKPTSMHHCTICDMHMLNDSFTIKMHEAGSVHKTNLQKTQQPLPKTTMKTNEIQTQPPTETYCFVCKVNIPNTTLKVKEHNDSDGHKYNDNTFHRFMMSLVDDRIYIPPYIPQRKTDTVNVLPCIQIEKATVEAKKREKETSPNIANPVVNGFCYVCKTKVPDNPNNIKDHVNGKRHRNLEKAFNPTKVTTGIDAAKTKIGNTISTTTAEKALNPIKASAGTDSIKTKPVDIISKTTEKTLNPIKVTAATDAVKSKTVETTSTANTNLHKPSANSSLKNDTKIKTFVATANTSKPDTTAVQPQNKGYYICEVCDSEIPNTPFNIKEHLKGSRHKSNLDKLINSKTGETDVVIAIGDTNKSDTTDTKDHKSDNASDNLATTEVKIKNNYHCEVCQTYLSNLPSMIQEHLDGKRHKQMLKTNLEKVANNTVSANNEKATESANATNSNKSDLNTLVNLKTVENSTENRTQNNEMVTTKTPVNTVVKNEGNTNNINVVDDDSSDSEDDSDSEDHEGFYVCNICDQEVRNNRVAAISHVKSYRHQNNLKEKQELERTRREVSSAVNICGICKRDKGTTVFSIKNHNDTTFHQTKVRIAMEDNRIKMRDDGQICYCQVCDTYFSKSSIEVHLSRESHKLAIGDLNQ